jgi:hypothetical protein
MRTPARFTGLLIQDDRMSFACCWTIGRGWFQIKSSHDSETGAVDCPPTEGNDEAKDAGMIHDP